MTKHALFWASTIPRSLSLNKIKNRVPLPIVQNDLSSQDRLILSSWTNMTQPEKWGKPQSPITTFTEWQNGLCLGSNPLPWARNFMEATARSLGLLSSPLPFLCSVLGCKRSVTSPLPPPPLLQPWLATQKSFGSNSHHLLCRGKLLGGSESRSLPAAKQIPAFTQGEVPLLLHRPH